MLRCYGIRLCESRECFRTLWQRDINAAISILGILAAWLDGRPKPAAFRRPHEQQAAALAAQQALAA